ncbi:MAG: hypothetical protein AB1938_05575 [Myxococcota bacterium]
MTRILQAVTVAAVVGLSAPALACSRHYHHGSVGISLGNIFLGFSTASVPCSAPVVVAPQPVYVAPPPTVYVPPPAPVYVAPPPPVYQPPPVVMAPPPVAYVAPSAVYVPTPPPVVVAPTAPPMVAAPMAAPAPPAAAASVSVEVEKKAPPRPAFLGLKYLGGSAALVDWTSGMDLSGLGYAHSFGLETRFTNWFALRSDFEMRSDSRSWDLLGAKLWVPTRTFKPYISASLAMTEAYAMPGKMHWGVVGAAGIDIWLGKHFFIEAEARYRVSPGDCCRDQPHLTGLIGAGVAFF